MIICELIYFVEMALSYCYNILCWIKIKYCDKTKYLLYFRKILLDETLSLWRS